MKIQNLTKIAFAICLTLTACIYDRCSCEDDPSERNERECVKLWEHWLESDGLTDTSTFTNFELITRVDASRVSFCGSYERCCSGGADVGVENLDAGVSFDAEACDPNRPYTCFDAQ